MAFVRPEEEANDPREAKHGPRLEVELVRVIDDLGSTGNVGGHRNKGRQVVSVPNVDRPGSGHGRSTPLAKPAKVRKQP